MARDIAFPRRMSLTCFPWTRIAVAVAMMGLLPGAGCALSGSVSTSTVSVRGNEIAVSGGEWGGTIACGPEAAHQAPCEAVSTRQPSLPPNGMR